MGKRVSPEKPYFEPLSIGLAEETGELARVINNRYGDRHMKQGESESREEMIK
ncbi:MAG: hypothetical protein ABH804_01220 [archaeon]